MIFDEKPRTDLDASFHSETSYTYLDRSAREEMALVRALLNDWLSRYPQQPGPTSDAGRQLRAKMLGQFRSSRDRQQREAFWELYLHESFVRAGCSVLVRDDTPDFDVTFGDSFFHVEATVRGSSNDEEFVAGHVRRLRDALNAVDPGPWSLEVAVDVDEPGSPPIRQIRHQLLTWLRAQNIDELRTDVAVNGNAAYARFPTTEIEVGDWRVFVRAWPKRPDAPDRCDEHQAIGIWGSGEMHEVRNRDPLVDAIDAKARDVRRLENPVIVAVLLDRGFANESQIVDALYGTEANEISIDRHRTPVAQVVRQFRQPDGVWSRAPDRSAMRLDAVVVGLHLSPFSVSRAAPTIWTNPHRSRTPMLVPPTLPWNPRWVDTDNRPHLNEGPSPDQFFDLPFRWPEI